MKKLLVLFMVLGMGLALTGCVEEHAHDYTPEFDSSEIEARLDALELEPEVDPFVFYIIEALTSGFVFLEEGESVYTDVVEAYGWSDDFVFEVVEGSTYRLIIWVENDLEVNYYFLNGIDVYADLVPHVGDVPFTVEFLATEPYLFVSFESWDELADSEFSIRLVNTDNE